MFKLDEDTSHEAASAKQRIHASHIKHTSQCEYDGRCRRTDIIEQCKNIKIAKITKNMRFMLEPWFQQPMFSHKSFGYNSESEIFATIIKKLCCAQNGITYEMMECSQFMWFSIVIFNIEAAKAIFRSIPNVIKFCKKNNILLPPDRGYPHAIHFAILSAFPETWDISMHKYWISVPMSELSPGCIVSWRFDSFGKYGQNDTGHTGFVTSHVGEDNRFKFGHSIPANKDEKGKGGLVQTIFSTRGAIIKSIANGKVLGGGMRLNGVNIPFNGEIDKFLPPYNGNDKISFNSATDGKSILHILGNQII